jgi:arsenate reductase
VEVFSAGSSPGDAVNPVAVEAMAEVGIDIAGNRPQKWTDDMVRAADVVISMGCGDTCPVYPGKRYVDWELDDPHGQGIETVRPIRDEIERRIRGLLVELSIPVTR